MKKIIFDFKNIENKTDFYNELKNKIELPEYFGNNLDALWDLAVSGDLGFPLEICFINFSRSRGSFFRNLAELLRDAEIETEKQIIFKTYRGEE